MVRLLRDITLLAAYSSDTLLIVEHSLSLSLSVSLYRCLSLFTSSALSASVSFMSSAFTIAFVASPYSFLLPRFECFAFCSSVFCLYSSLPSQLCNFPACLLIAWPVSIISPAQRRRVPAKPYVMDAAAAAVPAFEDLSDDDSLSDVVGNFKVSNTVREKRW